MSSSTRRSPSGTPVPAQIGDRTSAAPTIFLSLAADGSELGEDQRSTVRKAAMAFAILILALAAPLYWVSGAQGASGDAPQAVVSKSDDDDGDDDDDDAGDGTNSNPGTGAETRGNTDAGGQNTGGSTRGETDGNDGTGATERTQGSRGSNAASDTGNSGGGSNT